jgi:hypothetical protein
MGNFSRNTFDKMKHYVGVRLQQGVPIVDADWNELEDIRKYELQAFLKWFVGNGVPAGNDGFRILPSATENDFAIQGGDNTAEGAGRCLVEGWDVLIETSLNYVTQPLYDNAALAAQWGVDGLASLTPPAAARIDLVYLDVWEREVGAREDFDHLVNPAIGLETCVRLKREWVVRVAEGVQISLEPLPENVTSFLPPPPTGHSYYGLAALNRRTGQAALQPSDIIDLRRTGLTILPYQDIQQIVSDSFGNDYTLDHDGRPNLKVSLREAINALLRGGLPNTPEEALTTDWQRKNSPVSVKDSFGDIWLFWDSTQAEPNATSQIWYARYVHRLNAWRAAAPLTQRDAANNVSPFVVADNHGDIWLFWHSTNLGQNSADIWHKRYNSANGQWSTDRQLTTATSSRGNSDTDEQGSALVDNQGKIWVFWQRLHDGSFPFIYYTTYDDVNGGWTGEHETSIVYSTALVSPVAASANNRDIWLFSLSNGIQLNQYTQTNQSWGDPKQITTDARPDNEMFVLRAKNGDLWLFWSAIRNQDSSDIWYKTFSSTGGEQPETPLTADPGSNFTPFAMQDSSGGIWVFWKSSRSGRTGIWYKRYSQAGGWSPQELALSIDPAANSHGVSALQDEAGDIWTFWVKDDIAHDGTVNTELWSRQLIATI